MSAYSKNYFKDGYVEKGDTVYVLSQKIAGYEHGDAIFSGYQIDTYTVTAVGRKYLSARDANVPQRRIEKFEPLLSWEPAYGMYLTEVGTPLGSKGWRNRLFPSRRLAETCKKILEERDAEQTANGGGGQINADSE